MAGIAGMVGRAMRPETLKKMLDKLAHRGPDERWTTSGAGYALGACASLLGAEPQRSHLRNERLTVVFDGELYEPHSGAPAHAEALASAYEKCGRIFAGQLDGAFAAALWDGRQLVLARDPVGIRPLYWGYDDRQTLFFASELKALVGLVDQVHELSPGTVFSSTTGVQSYLPYRPQTLVPDSEEAAKTALRDLLFQATQRRLQDGAVGGMLLSGGLDSSIIAAIANQLQPGLPAFTVGVEGAPDLPNAALMARYLGLEHHVELFDAPRIKSTISTAVHTLESFDEDCISGALANLLTSQWVSGYTHCILSGEGGDELNGGYLLLKDLPDDETRRRVMERLIAIAYNTALQRLDRAMLGHSLSYRTPFLDSGVVAFCLQLPVQWKVRDLGGGRLVEKWLLREAFKELLPEQIYQREKLRFSGGTGTDALLESIGEELIAAAEFTEEARLTPAGYRLNSPKELYYYRLFQQHFPGAHFESLVGRWDPGK